MSGRLPGEGKAGATDTPHEVHRQKPIAMFVIDKLRRYSRVAGNVRQYLRASSGRAYLHTPTASRVLNGWILGHICGNEWASEIITDALPLERGE